MGLLATPMPSEPYFPPAQSGIVPLELSVELPSWTARLICNVDPREVEGPLILLLHGSGGVADSWLTVVRYLSATASWLAVDLPGFGKSSAPAEGPTPDASVRALRELLAWTGSSQSFVVGHSLGALAALHWSSEEGAQDVLGFGVFSGTLLSAIRMLDQPLLAIRRDPRIVSTALMQTLLVGVPWPSAVRRFLVEDRFARHILLRRFIAQTDAVPREVLDRLATASSSGSSLTVLKNVKGYDVRRRFGRCERLTFAIAGAKDGLIDLRDLEEFASLVPSARVERVEGASHWITQEYPRYTARMIDALTTG